MWHHRVMAFDTETTGFSKSSEVVELALVFYEDGVEVDHWDTMIRPVSSDPADPKVQEALGINHLTMEKLAEAYPFHEMADEIAEQMRRFPVWVAHNAPFDERMMRQEFDRIGKAMPEAEAILCTMTIDKALNANVKGRKLVDVCTRWGVTLDDAHEATADARACGDVLVKMVKSGMLPDDLSGLLGPMKRIQQQDEAYFNRRRQQAEARKQWEARRRDGARS